MNTSIQEQWEMSGGNSLLCNTSFQELFDQEDKQYLLIPKDLVVYCIDEGTPNVQHQPGLSLAGSGLLLDIDQAVKWLKPLNVAGVSAHQDCGAAALKAKRDGFPEAPDDHAVWWSKMLAKRLDVPYVGQISTDEMKRPANLHTARAVYYDGTGALQIQHAQYLPHGFTISRGVFRKEAVEYLIQELEVACNIAFGDRGFGEKFTNSTPFYVVLIGTRYLSLEILKQEVQAILQQYGDRVVMCTIEA